MTVEEFLKIKVPGVEDFLALEHPEEFDFKDLMGKYYQRYSEKHHEAEYQVLLQNLPNMITDDNIKKWYLYKTLDRDIDKRYRLFDCDSWNDTCELTSRIYDKLWRESGVLDSAVRKISPDTMNSFAGLFNRYMGKTSFRESYAAYDKKEMEICEHLMDYARNVGCLGNFVLVPKGYNVYRANHFEDDWRLSLDNLLQNTGKSNWLPECLSPTQYINLFFLWDWVYVAKENGAEKYAVNPISPEAKEPREMIPRLNKAIVSRGKFMVRMLRIALDEPDRYTQLMNKLAEEGNPLLQSTNDAEKFLGL